VVSAHFHDTRHIITDTRYELYFMPVTDHLADAYLAIMNTLDNLDPELRTLIAYVALRLVPFTSYYKRNVLPRIIVQLTENTTQAEANKIASALYDAIESFAWNGDWPRYSSPITRQKVLLAKKTPVIFAAYGSGDYKMAHPEQFERKGSWFWRASDDMAYKDSKTQSLRLP
jgi:hypothetical protein